MSYFKNLALKMSESDSCWSACCSGGKCDCGEKEIPKQVGRTWTAPPIEENYNHCPECDAEFGTGGETKLCNNCQRALGE